MKSWLYPWSLSTKLYFSFPLWTDSDVSQHSSCPAAESEADVNEEDMKDLRGNKMLSTEAKNILSDLDLDTDDESGG